jgi:UDP-N-acetylglucosamine 2-epimerase (non-hydrolysing)
LIEPPDYETFVYLMKKSWIIVTDSGGVQEEAPTLSKPLVIVREVTERPECVEAGAALLIGADPQNLIKTIRRLHDHPAHYYALTGKKNPFGDGCASAKIIDQIDHFNYSISHSVYLVTTPNPHPKTDSSRDSTLFKPCQARSLISWTSR